MPAYAGGGTATLQTMKNTGSRKLLCFNEFNQNTLTIFPPLCSVSFPAGISPGKYIKNNEQKHQTLEQFPSAPCFKNAGHFYSTKDKAWEATLHWVYVSRCWQQGSTGVVSGRRGQVLPCARHSQFQLQREKHGPQAGSWFKAMIKMN